MTSLHNGLLFSLVLLSSCIGGGTHGAIKGYRYAATKDVLQKTVESVIERNGKIKLDSVKDYYNDGENYVSISIASNGSYSYVFRYYGGPEYWDSSKTSEIFIAYAHDPELHGGSEGNGGVKWYDYELRRKLTEPFERELVRIIDSTLGTKHTETD